MKLKVNLHLEQNVSVTIPEIPERNHKIDYPQHFPVVPFSYFFIEKN